MEEKSLIEAFVTNDIEILSPHWGTLKLMGITFARLFCVFDENQTWDYSIDNKTWYEFSQSHEFFL